MNAPREERSRPAEDGTATQESIAGQASQSLRPAADTRRPDTHTVAAAKGYAVLVTVPGDPEPRTRRRLFLSLHSAQRAVERSEARGLDAQLMLVRLIPEGVGAW